eukprot:CAMPEP_0170532302 /NCGR_PEP_ID=MMETSP0209-20121228/70579_1 /TAXON_ID=665100 ORGANISM="Litonotus pictus, Strain P1" /NCGR_SAMPLE_ID=MMETSP0209 /ASSEMBLY_ACC=CAM_ASM_000301 /LENGTH=142 /DNA_ID=CAMNT_0010828205 /DNA_START=75 /DNA_END=503 /DNA_ORIENTATION=-
MKKNVSKEKETMNVTVKGTDKENNSNSTGDKAAMGNKPEIGGALVKKSLQKSSSNEELGLNEAKKEVKEEGAMKEHSLPESVVGNISLTPVTEAEEIKCNYCNRELEEEDEVKVCGSCGKVKYCNSTCYSKDLKFHKKKCSK